MEKNYKVLVDARISEALSDTAPFIKIHSPDFNEGGAGTAAPDDAQNDDARFPSWLASGKARIAELEQHRRRRKKGFVHCHSLCIC